MSIIRIIRAGDCPEIPWKNGGGTTREIAVFPPGAGMSDFDWRLSMAKVEQPGPFSAFPGIDRVLTVLEGELALTGPSMDILLTSVCSPVSFRGDMEVSGRPADGPVLDVNAMIRRGTYLCTVKRLKVDEKAVAADWGFLIALEPQILGGRGLARLDCMEFGDCVAVGGDALHINIRRI